MRGLLTCGVLMVAAARLGAGDVVTAMTPERIREAIAEEKAASCYPLDSGGKWLHGESAGCFTTPYSRVAHAAQEAKAKYQTFSEADVRAEMLEPVIEVIARPPSSFIPGRGRVGPPLNVTAVVVAPAKSKDRAAAIMPTRQTELEGHYKNLLGAEARASSLVAVFPLAVVDEKNEVRFVYDGMGCSDWKNKLSSECAVRFNLKDVK